MKDSTDQHIKILTPWINLATPKIKDRIETARAHAELSLTKAVMAAPEGRKTWRAVATQQSMRAAQKRITELQSWLVGSTPSSLDGMIQDARAKFYANAHRYCRDTLPSAIISDDLPTATGERKARGLIIFGLSPRQELEPAFLSCNMTLQTAINAAAVPSVTDKARQAMLNTWEQRTIESITSKVRVMLSDSQIAILNMVGHELIKPEFRA